MKPYRYKSFAFRIWDLFKDFKPSNPNILLRIQMYDPRYFTPSQCSYLVTVNLEPAPGVLSVQPARGGSALQTSFIVSLSGWYDEDAPLTYRYMFYTRPAEYDSERAAGDGLVVSPRNILTDFTASSRLQLTLPQGFYDRSVGTQNY